VDNNKIYDSKKYLLDFLGIKDNFLYSDFSSKYKEKIIPKKNGGERKIKPPNLNLKKVQRKILDKILFVNNHLPCVYGLSKEKNILNNAKAHQKNATGQLLALDIKDFFPSVPRKYILKIFKKLKFNKENASILTKICTVDDSLPQGAPTSPYLASMACIELDKKIYSYCKRKNLIYTRYFDDISISGKNISDEDVNFFEKVISENGFCCNDEKKKFFEKNDDKIINGVLISQNTMLSVSENYKNEIRDIYKKLVKNDNLHDKRIFAGKFGFYLYINKKEATAFLESLKKEKF